MTWVAQHVCLRLAAVVLTFGLIPAAQAEGGFVGLQIQGLSPAMAAALGLEAPRGVLVRDVAQGGPADKAGVRRGDLIVEFDGRPVATLEALVPIVQATPIGKKVPVVVTRGADRTPINLEIGPWPEAWRVSQSAFHLFGEAGVTVSTLTDKVRERFGLRWSARGAIVTLVDPEKAGKVTDLKPGEVIVQANQEDVWLPAQLADRVARAKAQGRAHLLLLVEGADGFRYSLLPVR
jgi:serine protease Do